MRAAPTLRTRLDADWAAAFAAALPDSPHAAPLAAVATAGDGAAVRHFIALAPHAAACAAADLQHVANLEAPLAAPALRALLEQAQREAALAAWTAREEATAAARRPTRAVPAVAAAQLTEDMVAALRLEAHTATCAPAPAHSLRMKRRVLHELARCALDGSV